MIDLFIRHTKQNFIRDAMFDATLHRWAFEPVKIHVMDSTQYRSVRHLRMEAESQATSDPYIFTDDDLLPMGKDWVERAVDIMLRNHDYAIASTLSIIEGENAAKPPADCEIYEMHAVGAPMIIRKGTCILLPEMTIDNECGTIHKMVLDSGKKEGLLWGKPGLPLRHMHMGHGFSSNPVLHWAY